MISGISSFEKVSIVHPQENKIKIAIQILFIIIFFNEQNYINGLREIFKKYFIK